MKRNAEDLTKSRESFMSKNVGRDEDKEKNGSTFLQKIKKDVYDKEGTIADLGERVARNVHHYSRNLDEKGGFKR